MYKCKFDIVTMSFRIENHKGQRIAQSFHSEDAYRICEALNTVEQYAEVREQSVN